MIRIYPVTSDYLSQTNHENMTTLTMFLDEVMPSIALFERSIVQLLVQESFVDREKSHCILTGYEVDQ